MDHDGKKEYIETKLITGDRLYISKKSVVGYCHFSEHKGSITKTLLKKHECVAKGCHYFEKYKDNPYWKGVEQAQAAKQKRRETARRIKKEEEKQRKEWIDTARIIADDLEYELKVITIKKIPHKNYYILFYLSKVSKNDWYLYFELAKAFGAKLGGRVELRHIVDINGYYATF